MPPGTRIIQEQIAQELGVSRQPVQQALLLLRNQGILLDAPGRGLLVAPLDPEHVRHMYDIRAVIEGLACRKAAEINSHQAKVKGPALIRAGRQALRNDSISEMIAADIAFHGFIYSLSENPLVAPTMETHWTYTHRVMGEVLMRDEQPQAIWNQHESMLEAIASGDAQQAEDLARQHISQAANLMVERLRQPPSHSDVVV
ncbi:MAG: GntR family transcriptional regulator [Candidatus Entotheonella gemina]|uniref:GntR family transcriptional regulator n=1 Tax=Candidatus Entotheonella gemina TaxID=1429439 RepID=W4M5I9_9BACT|nr:MAG: GntR family transcriptional regulator [Candidatus Entotheonella gemina]